MSKQFDFDIVPRGIEYYAPGRRWLAEAEEPTELSRIQTKTVSGINAFQGQEYMTLKSSLELKLGTWFAGQLGLSSERGIVVNLRDFEHNYMEDAFTVGEPGIYISEALSVSEFEMGEYSDIQGEIDIDVLNTSVDKDSSVTERPVSFTLSPIGRSGGVLVKASTPLVVAVRLIEISGASRQSSMLADLSKVAHVIEDRQFGYSLTIISSVNYIDNSVQVRIQNPDCQKSDMKDVEFTNGRPWLCPSHHPFGDVDRRAKQCDYVRDSICLSWSPKNIDKARIIITRQYFSIKRYRI